MLKRRIFTATILIALFVFLLFKLNAKLFCLLTSLIVLGCGWEWSQFLGFKTLFPRLFYCFIFLFIMFISFWLPLINVLSVATLFWIMTLPFVIFYPRASSVWGKSKIILGIMGFIIIIPAWLAINLIRSAENGVLILLFLFILIWSADSCAYFAGKKWGKHKLIPAVSPGKSWEGLLGALFGSGLVILLTLIITKAEWASWSVGFLISWVSVLFSILGDLVESMCKRNVNLKDSGHLLPGHGGLLDRMDSLMAAAPVFALGAYWFG